jgi:hypothetical protein
MKFGFILTSSPVRPLLLDRSFSSLIRTNTAGLDVPVLHLVHREPVDFYNDYVAQLKKTWVVVTYSDIPGMHGINSIFSVFGDNLINTTDITHIGFLVDDFIYNPEWLIQLSCLIKRHPDAKAWSVYRSRFTRHHRILHTDDYGDVVMSMHDCIGTMTREEWLEYKASKINDFTCPEELGGGNTIDIHHAYARKGDRWATGRDYMENLGRHSGIEQYDCAIDFVGE